jgi:DedD protein
MAENQDVNMLKRRGRRRLVGAIALVLAAVVVLPMVFDSEPKGSAPPVSVRIPGEDDTGFTPKVTPRSAPIEAQRPAEKAVTKAAEAVPEKAPQVQPAPVQPENPAPKVEIAVTKGSEKPAAKAKADVEQKRAEAALTGEQFMVPAGAYVDPAGVIEKLKEAKIPYYTEPIATKQGTVTRVRAGPFASRDAADKAMQQLKGLGLKPGNVASKT